MLIDIFPPVLVKEIRQGLKTKVFAFTLIGQQMLMVVTILFYLLGVGAGNDISFANGLFWLCFCVPLLAIMPARGFLGIHEERSQQTLELLFLTRLSARQIVVGKWIALFAQSLLIVVATLPYMVIRYFLGGIDISADLAITGWLTLASGVLTAAGIGLSAVEHKAIRVLVSIVAVLQAFPLLSFGLAFFVARPRSGGISAGLQAGMIASIIGLCLFGGAYALFFGASLIAPQAENHALPKRVLGLLAIGAITIMSLVSGQEEFMAFCFPLLVLVGSDALTEIPPKVWSVYARRDGSRWPLPLCLRPFLPGWPSGMIYLGIVSFLCYVLMLLIGGTIDDPGYLILSLLMGLLYPLPLIFLLGDRIKRIGPVYILIQVVHVTLSILMMTAIETSAISDATAAGLFPASTFLVTMMSNSNSETAFILLCMLTGLGLIVVFLKVLAVWKKLRLLEPTGVQSDLVNAVDA